MSLGRGREDGKKGLGKSASTIVWKCTHFNTCILFPL